MFNIYSVNYNGHRRSYVDVFLKKFNCNEIISKKDFFNKKPLLFLMVEDSFLLYVIISLIRSLFRYKTMGLIFCANKYVVDNSFNSKVKYLFLFLLNKKNGVINISIIPNYVDRRLDKICNHWIYDPQFWDLNGSQKEIKISEKDSIYFEKEGVLISSIGEQRKKKGLFNFIDNAIDNSNSNIIYRFFGKLDESSSNYVAENKAQCYGVNRFITDEEIEYIYSISDYVWCCYEPDYDQASGIFGRAIQKGITVIVRDGSCLHKICLHENIRFILPSELKNISISNHIVDMEKIKMDNKMREDYSLFVINELY